MDRQESVPLFKSNFARSYYGGDSHRSGSRQLGNINERNGNDSCGRMPSSREVLGGKKSSGSLHSSQLNGNHQAQPTANHRHERPQSLGTSITHLNRYSEPKTTTHQQQSSHTNLLSSYEATGKHSNRDLSNGVTGAISAESGSPFGGERKHPHQQRQQMQHFLPSGS